MQHMWQIKVAPVAERDIAGKLNLLAAVGPAATLIVVLAIAAYIRWHLGRWPTPYVDAPRTVAFVILHYLLIGAASSTYVGFPVWALTTPWLLFQRRFALALCRFGLFVSPLVVILAILRWDPTSFSKWLID